MVATTPNILEVGKVLNNKDEVLSKRFRALFMLRNLGGNEAIEEICRCLVDESDLLNHELAYCLGQMQDVRALPKLVEILKDESVAPITRHESAEAIAAIGDKDSLEVLQQFCKDAAIEVAETCQLAVARLQWNMQKGVKEVNKKFNCVDPAPTLGGGKEKSVAELEGILMDQGEKLFERYRAMFQLRDMMTDEAAVVLAKGLKCPSSALFRHEIGFVLGQMQLGVVTPQLIECVRDRGESPMVRHECAEALGSIATEECVGVLKEFSGPGVERVVRESCEVALDMLEYENSEEFHYAL